jgi:hypothetical protein
MEAFHIAIFVGMYEVERGSTYKLMRFVACVGNKQTDEKNIANAHQGVH